VSPSSIHGIDVGLQFAELRIVVQPAITAGNQGVVYVFDSPPTTNVKTVAYSGQKMEDRFTKQ
jgi:hypothetical protein